MRFIKVFPLLIINLLVPYGTTAALHSTVVAEKKHRISVDIGLAHYTTRTSQWLDI